MVFQEPLTFQYSFSLSFKHVYIASCWVHPGSPWCPLTLLAHLHFPLMKDDPIHVPRVSYPTKLFRNVLRSVLYFIHINSGDRRDDTVIIFIFCEHELTSMIYYTHNNNQYFLTSSLLVVSQLDHGRPKTKDKMHIILLWYTIIC